MKEQTLVIMKNQLNELTTTMEAVKRELFNIRELAIGTMELMKKLDGYEAALESLKAEINEEEKPKLEE